MNCKLCLQDYNDSNRQPEILIPCCHTFCSSCLIKKPSCPVCNHLIFDLKTNTAIIDALNQNSFSHQEKVSQIESNLKSFYVDYNLKLRENIEKLNEIDDQITNRVNQLVEVLFQNHFTLKEQLQQCKSELKQQLSQILETDDESIKNHLDLIKSNLFHLDATKKDHLNDDLDKIMHQVDSKLNDLEQFKFEIKFKQNDLIVKNSEDIVGRLVNESTIIGTLQSETTSPITNDEQKAKNKNVLDLGMESTTTSEQSLKSTDESKQVDPVQNKQALEFYIKGNLANKSDNLLAALEFYDKAIELDPLFVKAYNNKGTILSEMKLYSKAIDCFSKTIEIDPFYIFGYNNIGICYCSLKEYEKAIEQFDLVLQLNPDYADALQNKTFAMNNMNKLKNSSDIKSIRKEVKSINYEYCKLCKRGKSLMKDKSIKSLEEAIDFFEKAITLSKFSVTAYQLKGSALNDMKRYGKAIHFFDLALRYVGKNDHSMQSVIYANKGVSLMQLNEYGHALTNFDKALILNSGLSLAKINRDLVIKLLKPCPSE